MPIINGIKMACEPCIRGHRSTKCNHANERVMLPVRKPGRPLSVCPHPPNSACSCGSVTAAIPRSRKCGCGPKTAAAAGSRTSRSPTKGSFFRAPTSPKASSRGRIDPSSLERVDASQMNIHPAPSSGWGQGAAAGAASGAGVGAAAGTDVSPPHSTLSNHEATAMLPAQALGYMPAQPNSSKLFASFSHPFSDVYPAQTNQGHLEYNSLFGTSMNMAGMMSAVPMQASSFADILHMAQSVGLSTPSSGIDGFPGQGPPPYALAGNAAPATTTATAPSTASTAASMPPPALPGTNSRRSCCGGGGSSGRDGSASSGSQRLPDDSRHHTPTSSTNSLSSNYGTATTSASCCSSPPLSASSSQIHPGLKAEEADGLSESLSDSTITPAMASGDVKLSSQMNGQFAASHVPVTTMDQQVYYQQAGGAPAWYRYQPEYGTISAPLQQSQWRSGLAMSMGSNPDPNQDQNSNPFDATDGLGNSTMAPAFAPSEQSAAGDANSHLCSCGDDCECIGCVAHPYNNATQNTIQSAWSALVDDAMGISFKTPTTSTMPVSGSVAASPSAMAQRTPKADAQSPLQTPTPSSDTSGASEDQVTLSADDFLFVSYSVMGGCSGEDITCPCGDDCQCVGCTIHNNTPR